MKYFYFCSHCNKPLIACINTFVLMPPSDDNKRKCYCNRCYEDFIKIMVCNIIDGYRKNITSTN